MKLFSFKKRKKLKGLRGCSYRDFLILFPLCTDEKRKEIVDWLNAQERPAFLNNHEVMKNLNGINYGQLDDLSRVSNENDPFAESIKILLNIDDAEIYDLPVDKVFGFCNFVTKEIERINKLFSSISIDHTADEISAGIEQLNFGSFGVLDWYAQRMKISNQNDVRAVSWMRIYTCMKNDTAQAQYERRYNQIILNKTKSKKR